MPGVWSVPRRVAFRFGFIALVGFVYPMVLGLVPGTERLAAAAYEPWRRLVLWFAEAVLGLDPPSTLPTGSGDTTYAWVSALVLAIVAALGTIAWSIADRRRTSYTRLAAATTVLLRYTLAIAMVSYGVAKLVEGQFPTPNPARLDQRIGDMSPMGLLWTFMGHSTPYTMFGGLLETVAGVLLVFRRTAILGALLAMTVMTNVVMLNFSYDVPVKLFSMQLLLIGGMLVLPHARRLLGAMLGHATPEVPPVPRMAPRWERARRIAKLVVLGSIAWRIHDQLAWIETVRVPPNALHGIWVVETWAADGTEHPPLLGDRDRWRKLIVTPRGVVIRTMPDERRWLAAEVDPERQRITVERALGRIEIWHYTQPDPEHLTIDGSYGPRQLHVTLVREPDPLLVTRGFHWIQEAPFYR